MTYNKNPWHTKVELRTGKYSTTILHPLNNPIEVFKVLPNKPTYAWVLWYGLIGVIEFLVYSHLTFDWHVVNVGDCDMRDFSLQDEDDVVMKDQY
jgi:hypothetical protein